MGQQIRCGVFIGLGGSGLRVGLQLKRLFLERFGEVPPVFRILVFDTDDERSKELVFQSNGRQVELEADREFFYLRFSLAGLVRQFDARPYLSPWFALPELKALAREEANINKGAPQKVRKVGRTAFFERHAVITSAILHAADSARGEHEMTQTKDSGYEIPEEKGNGIDFYIASSLCGGTGSGMFLDVATFIRSQRRDREDDIVEGYLFLPGAFPLLREEERRVIRANAYASLMELDHFMNVGEYSMRYGPGREAIVRAKPLPFCYLIDGSQSGTKVLRDTRDLSKIVAEAIFVRACNPISSELESTVVSAGQYTNREVDGRYAAYSSMGVASRFVPRDQLLSYSMHLLAAQLVGQLLDPYRRGSPGSGLEKRESDERWQNAVQQAANDFTGANPIGAYIGRLDDRPGGAKVQADLIVGARQFLRYPREELVGRLSAVRREQQHKVLPRVMEQIQQNRNRLLSDYALALEKTCAQHADDREKGPAFVLDFLAALGTLLADASGALAREEGASFSARDDLLERLEQQERRVAAHVRSWLRWHVINRAGRIGGPTAWVDALNNYLENEVTVRKFQYAKGIVDTLRGEAADLSDGPTIQQLTDKYRRLVTQMGSLREELSKRAAAARAEVQRQITIFEEPVLDQSDFETIFQSQAPAIGTFVERFFASPDAPPLHQWPDETPDRIRDLILSFCEATFVGIKSMTLEDGITLKQSQGKPISTRSVYNELRDAATPWIEYREEDMPEELPFVQEILAIGDRERSGLISEKGADTAIATTGDLRAALFYRVEHGITISSLVPIAEYREAYARELNPERGRNRRPLHLAPEYEFFQDPGVRRDRRDLVQLLAMLLGGQILTAEPGVEGIEMRYRPRDGASEETLAVGFTQEEALLEAFRTLRLKRELEDCLRRRLEDERSQENTPPLVDRMRQYLHHPLNGKPGSLIHEVNQRVQAYVERVQSV